MSSFGQVSNCNIVFVDGVLDQIYTESAEAKVLAVLDYLGTVLEVHMLYISLNAVN